MSLEQPAVGSRPGGRRTLAIAIAVIAGVAAWCILHARAPVTAKRAPAVEATTEPPPIIERCEQSTAPARPTPGPDVWNLLAECLKQPAAERWPTGVTVDDVRRVVLVEHDPAWFDPALGSRGGWYLPMSGEGEPDFPSGFYIGVPLDGSSCTGMLAN